MKLLIISLLATLALGAQEEDHEWNDKKVAANDPPIQISSDDAKKVEPAKNNKKSKTIEQPKDAGKWENGISRMITGGSSSARGQWPWQVYVLQDNGYMCGGSLIQSQWVLTAAHCVQGRSNFSLSFGATRRNIFEDGRITVETTLKYVHPNYSAATTTNDIALLKLPLPLFATGTSFIRTVKLPTSTTNASAGVLATASGWGRTNSSVLAGSLGLNHVNMTLISNTQCASVYGTTTVIASTLCASTPGGKSTCQGDSGGPLVIYEAATKTYIQVGVTSFTASNGCDKGFPAGFARVSSHLTWISNTLAAPASG